MDRKKHETDAIKENFLIIVILTVLTREFAEPHVSSFHAIAIQYGRTKRKKTFEADYFLFFLENKQTLNR